MVVRYANAADIDYLRRDPHISTDAMAAKIDRREVLLALVDSVPVGWLRSCMFSDVTPFMGMLFVEEAHRNKGVGSALIGFWEGQMKKSGHRMVMTSTQADELAQHLYRKLGYIDTGALLLPGDPAEIFLRKDL